MWAVSTSRFSVDCVFCGVHGAAVIGMTKKGWPFLTCRSCTSRAFLNSPHALEFIRVRHPDVLTHLQAAAERSREVAAAATRDVPAAATGS